MKPRVALSCWIVVAFIALRLDAESSGALFPCEDEELGPRAFCGHLEVAENADLPQGRKISLEIVVLRAAESSGLEPVFMLAGGPGQSATDLTRLAEKPFAEVSKVRDFVFVDHRGSGGSNPILCQTDTEAHPELAFGQLFDPDHVAECLEAAEQHADVTLYTSRHAVRDLEAVRKWLGYGKVLLWGGSGGTRTGFVYLREYPASIAGALFDGVVPTDFAAPSGFAPAAQRALGRVFEDCGNQTSCAAAYPELRKEFEKVLGLFARGPVATSFEAESGTTTVRMHRNDFAYTIRGILYNAGRTASLPAMIHRAAQTGDLSAFAEVHWRRDAAVRPSIAFGVHFAVYCAEDIPFIDWERIAGPTRKSFLGRYLLDQYGDACKAWRSNPEPAEFTRPVTSDAPVLMVSGYYDPSTPDGVADRAAEHLSNTRHVVARNEGHNASFGCARPLAIEFLKRGTLEGLGPACEGVGPIEFEVPSS